MHRRLVLGVVNSPPPYTTEVGVVSALEPWVFWVDAVVCGCGAPVSSRGRSLKLRGVVVLPAK